MANIQQMFVLEQRLQAVVEMLRGETLSVAEIAPRLNVCDVSVTKYCNRLVERGWLTPLRTPSSRQMRYHTCKDEEYVIGFVPPPRAPIKKCRQLHKGGRIIRFDGGKGKNHYPDRHWDYTIHRVDLGIASTLAGCW